MMTPRRSAVSDPGDRAHVSRRLEILEARVGAVRQGQDDTRRGLAPDGGPPTASFDAPRVITTSENREATADALSRLRMLETTARTLQRD